MGKILSQPNFNHLEVIKNQIAYIVTQGTHHSYSRRQILILENTQIYLFTTLFTWLGVIQSYRKNNQYFTTAIQSSNLLRIQSKQTTFSINFYKSYNHITHNKENLQQYRHPNSSHLALEKRKVLNKATAILYIEDRMQLLIIT